MYHLKVVRRNVHVHVHVPAVYMQAVHTQQTCEPPTSCRCVSWEPDLLFYFYLLFIFYFTIIKLRYEFSLDIKKTNNNHF